jgi:hypothetical protein
VEANLKGGTMQSKSVFLVCFFLSQERANERFFSTMAACCRRLVASAAAVGR